jgi:hypothetical protein
MDTVQCFSVHDLVIRELLVASTSWSIGVLGALAEFHRDEGEPCTYGPTSVVTERGALRIDIAPATRAIAYEVVTQNVDSWNHGVALCLPQGSCEMNARRAITELGRDHEAIRPQDRDAILFDLGLGSPYCDFGVRTADPERLAQLRAAVGTSLFDPAHDLVNDIPRWSPHRVFMSRLGRIEVYQQIGAPDGVTPDGPHTHLLQKLLRTNRTHSANLALPGGLVPCVTLYPANPVRDDHGHSRPFDAAYHAAFQALLETYGEPDVVSVKRAVWSAVRHGMPPDALSFDVRRHRSACRIALRQMLYTDGTSPTLAAWREAYEPALRPRLLCHREEQLSGHPERRAAESKDVTIPWRT